MRRSGPYETGLPNAAAECFVEAEGSANRRAASPRTGRFRSHGTTPSGLREAAHLQAFIEQLVESIRRIRYVDAIKARSSAPPVPIRSKNVLIRSRRLLFTSAMGTEKKHFGWCFFLSTSGNTRAVDGAISAKSTGDSAKVDFGIGRPPAQMSTVFGNGCTSTAKL